MTGPDIVIAFVGSDTLTLLHILRKPVWSAQSLSGSRTPFRWKPIWTLARKPESFVADH